MCVFFLLCHCLRRRRFSFFNTDSLLWFQTRILVYYIFYSDSWLRLPTTTPSFKFFWLGYPNWLSPLIVFDSDNWLRLRLSFCFYSYSDFDSKAQVFFISDSQLPFKFFSFFFDSNFPLRPSSFCKIKEKNNRLHLARTSIIYNSYNKIPVNL